jgi:hypothetical protein
MLGILYEPKYRLLVLIIEHHSHFRIELTERIQARVATALDKS